MRHLYLSGTPAFRPASLLDGLFDAPPVGAPRTLRMVAMQAMQAGTRPGGLGSMTLFVTDGLGGMSTILVDPQVDFRAWA
jgi:hypothetical protein